MKEKNNKIYSFKSETKKLLNIMIHSLYSNKEIFIRELISNASDAINKLKFKAISKPEKYKITEENYIRIKVNKKKKKLIISDNGIGMTYEETIKNLGTIARSGTKKFLSSIKKKQSTNNDELIGQFGVGFYSAFIVSNSIKVITKKKKSELATLWKSDGKGTYKISKVKKKKIGTKIILNIKNTEEIFLNPWEIKRIVKKYSDHITTPIEIYTYNEKTKDFFWDKINKAEALWTINKNNISKEDYKNFYKYISHDSFSPLTWIHNKVEGNPEYISLLYIPKKNNTNIWNKNNKNGLRLYINRIYIMDNNNLFLPNYLRFIKGLLDSQDLPLNVSRELLQNNEKTKKIKMALTKKILKVLIELSKSDPKKYNKFWKEYGLILKEGPAEEIENKLDIYKLLRFTSIKNNSPEQNLSLKDYVKNMQKNQKKIFYITADNYHSGKSNPHLEFFKENNIDVLILTDRIDEWMMNYLIEFNKIKFHSVNKLDISNNKKTKIIEQIENKPEIKFFIEKIKKILGNRIKDVNITNKLKRSPVVVTCDSQDMTTQMSKLFIAAGQKIEPIKYIFEINLEHKIIKYIKNIQNEKKFNFWINLLFDQALLAEKGTLENPNKFIYNINKLILKIFKNKQ